jgi:uncharacterized membrane protein
MEGAMYSHGDGQQARTPSWKRPALVHRWKYVGRVHDRRNVGEIERWGSMAAGTALALYGLSRRRPSGLVLAALGGLLVRRGATGHCYVYEKLDLNTATTSGDTRRVLGGPGGCHVEEVITIDRSASELYAFWRNLENLPRFMQHLESVEQISAARSRWRARVPWGPGEPSTQRRGIVEWNAEIINDIPHQLIAWRSLDDSDVVSAGSVHFDETGLDRGTRIRVRLQYSPPGGKIGTAVAKLLGRDAATEIREDLRRFKQLIEAEAVSPTNDQSRGE